MFALQVLLHEAGYILHSCAEVAADDQQGPGAVLAAARGGSAAGVDFCLQWPVLTGEREQAGQVGRQRGELQVRAAAELQGLQQGRQGGGQLVGGGLQPPQGPGQRPLNISTPQHLQARRQLPVPHPRLAGYN